MHVSNISKVKKKKLFTLKLKEKENKIFSKQFVTT